MNFLNHGPGAGFILILYALPTTIAITTFVAGYISGKLRADNKPGVSRRSVALGTTSGLIAITIILLLTGVIG